MLRESEIEKKFKAWCKQKKILCIKFTPKGEKGWPDRICILPNGRHVWLELKRQGKEPTDLQYHRLGQLEQQGATARWADSLEQAKAILRLYDRKL